LMNQQGGAATQKCGGDGNLYELLWNLWLKYASNL